MKKLKLIIAALAFSFGVYAQNYDGAQLVRYERYSSAKEVLQKQSSEESKYYLGLAEIGLGNLDAASQIFSTMPNSEYGLAGMARVYFLKGDVKSGNDMVNKIVDNAKKRDYHKYQLAADAITYTQKGNIDNAIEWYKKAMEKEKTAELLVSLGDAYLLKRDALSNGEADRSFTEAARIKPNYSLAYSRMGKLMYDARNYEKALEFYEKAKTSDPNNPLPYRDLADAYYRAGKYSLAKQNADKYFSLSDATEDDMYQYINILFLTKDYEATMSKLNEVFAKNKNPKLYLNRLMAYSLYETKKYPEAMTYMNTFLNSEKNKEKIIADDYNYLGKIYAALSTTDSVRRQVLLDSANTNFLIADKMDTSTDKVEFYTEVANIFRDAGDYSKTADWYNKIITSKATPNSLDYYYYGFYSYYAKKYDQALSAFNTMYDKFEADRWSSEFWRGLVSAAKDQDFKSGLAEPYFINWLKITYPEGKTPSKDHLMKAYQYLAFHYYNAGKKNEAITYSKKILELDANNESANSIIKYYQAN